MIKSNLATYPHVEVHDGYAHNVSRAARALIAAVLAVNPAAPEAAVAKPSISERRRAKSVFELYRLAGSYDTVSPNLAAELRFIAARD